MKLAKPGSRLSAKCVLRSVYCVCMTIFFILCTYLTIIDINFHYSTFSYIPCQYGTFPDICGHSRTFRQKQLLHVWLWYDFLPDYDAPAHARACDFTHLSFIAAVQSKDLLVFIDRRGALE